MAKLIHFMIRVRDDKKSIAFYDQAFGLKVDTRLDFDGFSLIYLRNDENDIELELTHNHDQSEAYDLGNGYGHMAVVVDDLEAEHKRFVNAGFEPRNIVNFEHDGKPLASFFFVKDPDGYEIEVLKRHGRYR